MKLVIGLGNPGRQYAGTRHNVGFDVLDLLAGRHRLEWESAPADALMARWRAASALLAKPLTFMNLSGDAVAALARYYDIAAADLLVVVDDVDLPFGRLRARQRGSAGTHNGLRSIVNRLGTTEFPRLRVGVGRGDERRDLADHVLSKFERDEVATLDTVIARAADAAEMFAATDILEVMNTYNADDAASAATD
jgi:PTH1 family peptidyl-tRNA hydrolase